MAQELYHYGVLGMKWGIRRYQNEDGSLTSAGKTHYKSLLTGKENKTRKATDAAWIERKLNKLNKKEEKRGLNDKQAAKKAKLTTARNGLVKDLSDRDIEYGRHMFNLRKNLMITALIGPWTTAGYLALGKAPKEVARMTKENIMDTERAKNFQKKNR